MQVTSWEHATKVLDRHARELMRLPCVEGVGLQETEGSNGTGPVIMVYLSECDEREAGQLERKVPRKLEGVRVRAEVIGAVALQ